MQHLVEMFDTPAYSVHVDDDQGLTIDAWNTAAEGVFRWPIGETIGQPVYERVAPQIESSSRERRIENLVRRGWWAGHTTLFDRDERPLLFEGMCWTAFKHGAQHFVTVLTPHIPGLPHSTSLPQIAELPQSAAVHAKAAFARQMPEMVQAWRAMTAATSDPVARWIAANIRRRRLELGLSQEALALALGKHRQHVSMWENGMHPKRENLQRLADVLEMSLADLLKPPPEP
jgi:DNA-binding transcriptional regulator YiaG